MFDIWLQSVHPFFTCIVQEIKQSLYTLHYGPLISVTSHHIMYQNYSNYYNAKEFVMQAGMCTALMCTEL